MTPAGEGETGGNMRNAYAMREGLGAVAQQGLRFAIVQRYYAAGWAGAGALVPSRMART